MAKIDASPLTPPQTRIVMNYVKSNHYYNLIIQRMILFRTADSVSSLNNCLSELLGIKILLVIYLNGGKVLNLPQAADFRLLW